MIKKYLKPILLSSVHHRCAEQKAHLPRLSASKSSLLKRQNLTPIETAFVNGKYRHQPHLALKAAGFLVFQGLLFQGIIGASAQAASPARVGQPVLMVEMTPALCASQPSRARMRQCLEGYSLTVSGLDLGYGERCGRGAEPRLTPLQLKVVNRIMPDSTVRTQAWQRYGACSPLSAPTYFRQIVNYAGQLKLPNELNTGNSYTVSKSRFVGQMTRLNKGMTAASIDLICQKDSKRRQSVLTDVHVCYNGSQFGSCSKTIDNCGNNFIISGNK